MGNIGILKEKEAKWGFGKGERRTKIIILQKGRRASQSKLRHLCDLADVRVKVRLVLFVLQRGQKEQECWLP